MIKSFIAMSLLLTSLSLVSMTCVALSKNIDISPFISNSKTGMNVIDTEGNIGPNELYRIPAKKKLKIPYPN